MSATIEHRAAQKVRLNTHRSLARALRPAVLAVLDHADELGSDLGYHEYKIRSAIADALAAGMCRQKVMMVSASEVVGGQSNG